MLKKTFILLVSAFLLLTFFFAAQPEINAQSKKNKKNAEKLIKEGNKFFLENDYQTAIDRYAQAITLYPGNAEAHFWKGTSHYKLNQGEQAIYDLNLALQQGYSPLAIYKMRWVLFYQKQDYGAALKDAQAGLQLEPGTNYFPLALGDIYRSKQDYANAINYYEQVAAREPDNADLLYYMAVSYSGLGMYEKQIAAAQEALGKGTKFPGETWYLIGDAFFNRKNYDQAIEPLERSMLANKNIYETYTDLAEIYRNKGDFKKAISTLEKGLSVFPNDGGLLINLTRYHSLAGNSGEAIREGQKAIQYAGSNSTAFTNLCRAYNDSNLYKQALETCRKALEINSGDGETHYYMARAYVELSQPDKATAEYKLAVKGLEQTVLQSPTNADGLYLLGGAYLADSQYDNAIATYKRAIALIPLFARAHFNLAYAYHKKGEKKAAFGQYEKLSKIDPQLGERLLKILEGK